MDRQRFEILVEGVAHRFEEIEEMKQQRLISSTTRVFLIEDVQKIAHAAYGAGWTMCQLQENAKSSWSSRVGTKNAKEIILDSFK